MDQMVRPVKNFQGTYTIPGDKSISHRAVMFSAIAKGTSQITGFLMGEDCLSTISCFRQLGVPVHIENGKVIVEGQGLHGLKAPAGILDVGNSGTTMRLMTGILAGQNFTARVTGDASIQKRPMDRVFSPLRLMNGQFSGYNEQDYAPFTIYGNPLTAMEYTMPVASAQVKSAIILSGLYAKGTTIIHEPLATRDHTEIMLNYLGADITKNGKTITCRPVEQLYGQDMQIPGDISSAAFLIVAALIIPGSQITIANVGVNKTRTGILTALKNMGANIRLTNEKTMCGEPVADITVTYSPLKAITIGGEIIPTLIDEIPVLAVASAFAEGTTIIRDAQELKVKESNRIRTMTNELGKMGAAIEETPDGMVITGGKPLHGCKVASYNDHRIAMSMAIAGLAAEGTTLIQNSECVGISFPGYFDLFFGNTY